MDIAKILTERFPGAEWTLDGDDYAGLTWISTDQPKPTLTELEALWPDVQRGPFRDRLEAKFAEVVAREKANLNDEQLAEVLDRAAAIEKSYGKYEKMLGKADHKRAIIGAIRRIKNLPAGPAGAQQELIDFVTQEYV